MFSVIDTHFGKESRWGISGDNDWELEGGAGLGKSILVCGFQGLVKVVDQGWFAEGFGRGIRARFLARFGVARREGSGIIHDPTGGARSGSLQHEA